MEVLEASEGDVALCRVALGKEGKELRCRNLLLNQCRWSGGWAV